MAQEGSLVNQDAKTTDTIKRILDLVRKKTNEKVETELQPRLSRTPESERDSQTELLEKLEDALAQSNVVEVWERIAEINKTDRTDSNKTLDDFCTTIAERENNNDNGCHFDQCKKSICPVFEWSADDLKQTTEGTAEKMRSRQVKRRWIEVRSNPLYISLEWLWRNHKSPQNKGAQQTIQGATDIIEAAVDYAYRLEKIASYEHYYSRDGYKRRAEEYETFTVDIVGQVDISDSEGLNQLHEIMDIEGNGSLLSGLPANFNQSLSLLKLAADKQRKRVGTRLNGVIIYLVF